MKPGDDDYFVCPHCGAELPAKAVFCPECGSDEVTGWSEDSGTYLTGLPTGYADDEEFDYQQFLQREFGDPGVAKPRLRQIASAGCMLILAIAFILLVLRLVL